MIFILINMTAIFTSHISFLYLVTESVFRHYTEHNFGAKNKLRKAGIVKSTSLTRQHFAPSAHCHSKTKPDQNCS
jgi:hypothetical protein